MENSLALLALVSLLTLVFITKIIYNNRRPGRKPPPGPKPWPVIGNLNLIGSLPHHSIHSLSQKYGEIMLLKYGKFPVVVASSPEMAKQFLKVHDTVFASRPALANGKYTSYNYSGMNWAPYGPHWKQMRKICLSHVFNAKRLEFFERIRVEERHNLFSRLRSLSGKPVLLRSQLLHQMLSTISRIIFGNKYFNEEEDECFIKNDEFHSMVDEFFWLNGVTVVGDWIPWLSSLDLHGYVRRMKDLFKKFDRLFDYVVDDHQARRIAENGVFSPKDVVDVLLQQAEDPNLEVGLTRDCIKGLLQVRTIYNIHKYI